MFLTFSSEKEMAAKETTLTEPVVNVTANRNKELMVKRRQVDLQQLVEETKFTKEEIKRMYRSFKQVNSLFILTDCFSRTSFILYIVTRIL